MRETTLKPAIRLKNRLVVGPVGGSHDALIAARNLRNVADRDKGFTPNGTLFLDRKKAIAWLKAYDPETWAKVKDKAARGGGLHSSDYAEAKGLVKEEAEKDPKKEEKPDISKQTWLVWDKGLYLYLAQALGRKAKKVYYYRPDSSPYLYSRLSQIGQGLEEIEVVTDFEKYKKLADHFFFPDILDGAKQLELKSQGYPVAGCLGSEKLELDKIFFYEHLKSIGLLVAPYEVVVGTDALREYLKYKKGPKWLKTNKYRGDFETKKFIDIDFIDNWLEQELIPRIGPRRAKTIEIIVQDQIESVCECGGDRFAVNGTFTGNPLCGYEIKDKAYVGKIMAEAPNIIQDIDDAMSPIMKELSIQGHWSTEIRIDEDGSIYFIDPTPRGPSPPAEGMCSVYTNYPEALSAISEGKLPELAFDKPYLAMMVLNSVWNEKNELIVKITKEAEPYVKLKNHMKRDDYFVVIPNSNNGYYGAVIGLGSDMKSAIDHCLSNAEQMQTDDFSYDAKIFDEAEKQIEAGRKFGVEI